MQIVDLTGKRFGRLTVLSRSVEHGYPIFWNCKCDCGNMKAIQGNNMKRGNTKSCGCICIETIKLMSTSHKQSYTRLYRIYQHMRNRCYNKNVPCYYRYGGRGITVCDEWMKFEPFMEWAMSNGYEEHLTIDRKDNDLGYFPNNCRWATLKEQGRNRRNNVIDIYSANAIQQLRKHGMRNRDIAKLFGISQSTTSSIIHETWQ